MKSLLILSCFLAACDDSVRKEPWVDRVVSARVKHDTDNTKPIINKCGDFKGYEQLDPYFEVVTEKEAHYLIEKYRFYKNEIVLIGSESRYK